MLGRIPSSESTIINLLLCWVVYCFCHCYEQCCGKPPCTYVVIYLRHYLLGNAGSLCSTVFSMWFLTLPEALMKGGIAIIYPSGLLPDWGLQFRKEAPSELAFIWLEEDRQSKLRDLGQRASMGMAPRAWWLSSFLAQGWCSVNLERLEPWCLLKPCHDSRGCKSFWVRVCWDHWKGFPQ